VWVRSFSEVSGLGVAPLIVPVLISAGAAWAVWQRNRGGVIGGTALMGIFTFITGFSIGGAYIPALGLFVWGILAMFSEENTP
jgi:hypothetical protein